MDDWQQDAIRARHELRAGFAHPNCLPAPLPERDIERLPAPLADAYRAMEATKRSGTDEEIHAAAGRLLVLAEEWAL